LLAHSDSKETLSRSARMLHTALGQQIAAWLDDKEVVEIMLNPDGRLWLDRLTAGLEDMGERLSADDGERCPAARPQDRSILGEVSSGSPHAIKYGRNDLTEGRVDN
jgi:hypothetical protein